jgi:transposase-like protein
LHCISYKKYFSVRLDSFFENFNIPLPFIMRVIGKYCARQPLNSIIESLSNEKINIEKIITKLVRLIPQSDFSLEKLGGVGSIVQIDETMLNYKCKSHRGRSPTNRTDSLVIVEVRSGITKAFAKVIPNKTKETMIPIIVSQVAPNSIIWTDEHKTYQCLREYDFTHETICYKYEFVNNESGVNTQAVESFNNELKL